MVRVARLRAFLDYAATRGAPGELVLRHAGIAPGELTAPGARIACSRFVAAMRAARDLCGDPALALHFGEAVDVADLSLVGLVVDVGRHRADVFARLVRDALPALDAEAPGRERLRFQAANDGVWIVDARHEGEDFPELTESGFASLVCTGRRWLRGARFAKAMHMRRAAPSYRAEVERVFGMPVEFGCAHDALLVDADWAPPPARAAAG
jgi:hypothetical protein